VAWIEVRRAGNLRTQPIRSRRQALHLEDAARTRFRGLAEAGGRWDTIGDDECAFERSAPFIDNQSPDAPGQGAELRHQRRVGQEKHG